MQAETVERKRMAGRELKKCSHLVNLFCPKWRVEEAMGVPYLASAHCMAPQTRGGQLGHLPAPFTAFVCDGAVPPPPTQTCVAPAERTLHPGASLHPGPMGPKSSTKVKFAIDLNESLKAKQDRAPGDDR